MSSAFEFKENEVNKLRNQLKDLENSFELQKQKKFTFQNALKSKEKEINDLNLVITRLEKSLTDDKLSTSKKIDTFLKEISEKSQTIKNVTIQLKEMEKFKQDHEKYYNEILDLKNQLVQSKRQIKENELSRIDEQKKCIEELKLKSEEISNLKEELQLLENTLNENAKICLNLRNNITELNLKINDYKSLNKQLHGTIDNIKKEKEIITETMNRRIEENQLEYDKLSKLYKETLSQLNQDKLAKISEERSIESVIKDYNLLTEENAYLKKERQHLFQTFKEMLKKIKNDYENLKKFAKNQLVEWSSIFIKHVQNINIEYSTQIKSYHNKLIEIKDNLILIQNSYSILKSDCIQSLEYFKNEIVGKYNNDIMIKIIKNNEELEKRNMDLQKLQKEIDCKNN